MLYRFYIELSDIDREVYETLDFRVSQHPSEISSYLLTRVFAYALSYQEGLKFSDEGLSNPDAPGLVKHGKHNSIDLWIEIGNASSRKLHKATKNARNVEVYTYKNPDVLINDIKVNDVHRAADIKITAFDEKFISALEKKLEKNNRWSIVHQQNQLTVTIGEQSIGSEIRKLSAQ